MILRVDVLVVKKTIRRKDRQRRFAAIHATVSGCHASTRALLPPPNHRSAAQTRDAQGLAEATPV
eukprot:646922-Pleurochrysis_carterae.AAC.1